MNRTQETVASIRKPLRRADLAELLGVTTKTIDNRRRAGDLPPSFTCGAERLWRPEDVEAWMEERVQLEREAQAMSTVTESPQQRTVPAVRPGKPAMPRQRPPARAIRQAESAFVRRMNLPQ